MTSESLKDLQIRNIPVMMTTKTTISMTGKTAMRENITENMTDTFVMMTEIPKQEDTLSLSFPKLFWD